MRRQLFRDKHFYGTLLSLAIPIMIQNLISSCLNMIDTFMIGQLGEVAIAAVGSSNQFFFLLSLFLFGINSGSSIFTSQFWGKKDIKNIHRVMGLSLCSGLFIALIFTFGALIFPSTILRIFSSQPSVLTAGSKYLSVVAFTYIIYAVNTTLSFSLRSIGKPKLPMVISAVAILTNTVLNYVLIFGKFGFPAWGVRGAAIATLIARIVELVLLMRLVFRKDSVLRASISEMLSFSSAFVKTFYKTSSPVIANEGFWALASMLCTVAYSTLGTEALASIQITNTVQEVFLVVVMGLANSACIMIGNKIGEGEDATAILYSRRFVKLGVILGVICAAILFGIAPFILKIFSISTYTFKTSLYALRIMSLVLAFKFFNLVMVIGILRGGGDTAFAFITEISCMWAIAVPLAFLGAALLRLPLHIVIAIVGIEELVKTILILPRLRSNKWIHNIVHNL